jgi:tRNA(adenine34) deaminase
MKATDEAYMDRALVLADQVADRGNMGCGAVIVRDGAVIGEAGNTVVESGDPTEHAETMAIRDAARRGGDLEGATLYTTMEPCPMCLWGSIIAGVSRIVIGCRHQQLEAGVRTDLADYTTESLLKLTGRSVALEFGIRAEACEVARRRPFGKKK